MGRRRKPRMQDAPGQVVSFAVLVEAWNVDGSSSAKPPSFRGDTWLAWTCRETGRGPGNCAYAGCERRAQVGGHIWVKGNGVYVAPICRPCNSPDNIFRMQGAGAMIKAQKLLTACEYTDDMARMPRRFYWQFMRECDTCDEDITRAPDWHRFCDECYQREKYRSRFCEGCGYDITSTPLSRTMCTPCWREEQNMASYDSDSSDYW